MVRCYSFTYLLDFGEKKNFFFFRVDGFGRGGVRDELWIQSKKGMDGVWDGNPDRGPIPSPVGSGRVTTITQGRYLGPPLGTSSDTI